MLLCRAMCLRKGPGKRSGGAVLYVRQHSMYQALSWDGWWLKGQDKRTDQRDTAAGVCCRSSDQQKEADEPFYQQLEASPKSQALVLVGDFNHPDTCWRSNTAKKRITVEKVSGKHWWQLPVTGCRGSHKEWCAAWLHATKWGRPCWRRGR